MPPQQFAGIETEFMRAGRTEIGQPAFLVQADVGIGCNVSNMTRKAIVLGNNGRFVRNSRT